MSEDKTKLAKAKERMAKLLALAEKNPNEKEAMAALEKIAAIQAEFGLTIDDIRTGSAEAKAAETSEWLFSGENGQYSAIDNKLIKAIADYRGVLVGVQRDEDGDMLVRFFGNPIDVAAAIATRSIVRAAAEYEWKIYRDFVMDARTKETVARPAFMLGFVTRIHERLSAWAMKAVNDGPKDGKGTSLVVLKHQLVRQMAREHNFDEVRYSYGRGDSVGDAAAYGAGHVAGSRVDVNTGVGSGAGATRMIGKR